MSGILSGFYLARETSASSVEVRGKKPFLSLGFANSPNSIGFPSYDEAYNEAQELNRREGSTGSSWEVYQIHLVKVKEPSESNKVRA